MDQPDLRIDPRTDPRIDAYIERAAPFAQPVLTYLRKCMHEAGVKVQEDIKWGMPFFVLAGKPLANMAAFKQHCAFGFWKGRDVVNSGKDGEAMGQFGRITVRADLPGPRQMKALIVAAVARQHEQAQTQAAAPKAFKPAGFKPAVSKRAPLPMPPDFAAALAASPAAKACFDSLSPSGRYDYLEWVLDAKREATRAKRIAQAVVWLAEGKPRHWQHIGSTWAAHGQHLKSAPPT